jgi:hypothetical protein
MAKLPSNPIPSPPEPAAVSGDVTVHGKLIPPIERLRIFSDKEWEDFVWEWSDSLKSDYAKVEKCSGAGDMGRDIIAIVDTVTGVWDNYQCKRYDKPLKPSDVWVELGKLAYYTKRGDYDLPRRYYFAASQGVGPRLSNLLKKPDSLRNELLTNWSNHCRDKITTTSPVELDADMRAHIAAIDFSIFDSVPPLRILDGHAKTRWHIARFGGGLPERPAVPVPPDEPAPHEAVFVEELLAAYGDHLKKTIATPAELDSPDLSAHFGEARLEFYSAEALRTFSRDTLPNGAFDRLQDDVQSGIGDELRDDRHQDGYRKAVAVIKTARLLPLNSHAVSSRMSIRDRGGICHQMVNDKKFRWIK